MVRRSKEAKCVEGTIDSIFHYGCISHYDTAAPDRKHKVEGWARHEHWNFLYCMSMARHALEFLAECGTLVLKVRIFENLETMGLVSVLACAFERVYLYANPRMQAEFVAFVGVGFLGQWADANGEAGTKKDNATVNEVKRVMKASASYHACDIFDPAIIANRKFQETLKRAREVREEMRRDHDRVTLVLMQVMGLIHERAEAGAIRDYLAPRLAELNAEIPVEIDSEWSASVIAQVEGCIAELDRPERRDNKLALDRFVGRFKVGDLMSTCVVWGETHRKEIERMTLSHTYWIYE